MLGSKDSVEKTIKYRIEYIDMRNRPKPNPLSEEDLKHKHKNNMPTFFNVLPTASKEIYVRNIM